MNTVAQLLANKQHWNEGDHGHQRIERVHTINQAATTLDAAKMMNEHHIGSLIVTDSLNKIAGIITERDILTRIVTAQLDPATTPVSKAMTQDVIHCTPDSTLTEVRHLMTDCKIRHIPVIDHTNESDPLAGIISIGDLNAATNNDLAIEVKTMRQYITTG
ncbi:MAG: CBS domain-containing protein [Phycisphaerales bacterium]|nr:CBS domain-containing protein [Phycisphaerales bacterium]